MATGDQLFRFGLQGREPTRYDQEAGLEPGRIYDLVADNANATLWIATERGVTRFTSADQSFSEKSSSTSCFSV